MTLLRMAPWLAILLLLGVVSAQSSRIHKWHTQTIKLADQLKQIDAEARKARHDGERIAKDIKGKHDEESRRIAGDADALRLSGPGRALCPAVPASPGRAESGAKPDVARPALPANERAAVPWGWLVVRAEEHDALRAEVLAWREWYQRVADSWPNSTEAAH